MRVIAGSARSLLLKTPPGKDTRPTGDKTKETLFNVLQNDICGSVFVDLYAGSGSIGIEALSRGAKKAYFVENAPTASKCIDENLAHTKFSDQAVNIKRDAIFAFSNMINETIDILFMDPPYALHAERDILSLASASKYITEDTIIVVEADLEDNYEYLDELDFEVYKEKRYKTSRHIFIRKKANSQK